MLEAEGQKIEDLKTGGLKEMYYIFLLEQIGDGVNFPLYFLTAVFTDGLTIDQYALF